MKQRIVLATDSRDPSGMGEHMLTLGAALRHQYDMLIAAPEGEQCKTLLADAARRGLRIKAFDPHKPADFRQWLRGFGADLVHVHAGIGWEGHGLVRAARALGVPVIRTEHLPDLLTSPVQQAEYRAMLLSVDRRIAVSNAVAQSFKGRGTGRLDVVHNGIVPRSVNRTGKDVRAELGIEEGTPLLLTIARLTPQKGHDVLLKALPAVLETHPHVKLALVGTGPEQRQIESAIKAADLSASVMLLGARDDVPDLLAAADLFVLASHFEGLPLVVLEAMAAGLPVVATAIGGVIEALGDDHPHLAARGDAAALAQTIKAALSDRHLTASAAEKARNRFTEKFGAERMGEQTARIYQDFLSPPSPKAPAYA